MEEEDWVIFRPPVVDFSVEFPHEPTASEQYRTISPLEVEVVTYEHATFTEYPTVIYSVSYSYIPDKVIRYFAQRSRQPIRDLLESAIDISLESTPDRVFKSISYMSIRGNNALKYRATGHGTRVDGLLIYDNDRSMVYTLLVARKSEVSTEDVDTERFFGSFSIL